jgi:8-oxo-dGTP pyrophosphatase MutT (NUDIX family)
MARPAPPTLIPHDVLNQVTASAGGVLWRRSRGHVEVAIVHRRRKDDWSFPKGGLRLGESSVDAAVREVREETGYAARPETLLGSVLYRSRRGRSKIATYWLMTPLGGGFRSSREVDALAWLDLEDAEGALAGRAEAVLFDPLRELLQERLATTA